MLAGVEFFARSVSSVSTRAGVLPDAARMASRSRSLNQADTITRSKASTPRRILASPTAADVAVYPALPRTAQRVRRWSISFPMQSRRAGRIQAISEFREGSPYYTGSKAGFLGELGVRAHDAPKREDPPNPTLEASGNHSHHALTKRLMGRIIPDLAGGAI